MIARIQQLIALLLFAAVVAWALYFITRGPSYFAVCGALLIAGAYPAAIGFEFLLLRRSYLKGEPDRPSRRDLWAAWCAEVVIAPLVFLWLQPFRSEAQADSPVRPLAGGHGVLLVHGFFCNRGLWHPWMKRLREAKVPFVALTLEPVFGSIDDYAAQIDEAMARLEAATGSAPVLVAHSMGGLAARAWLCRSVGDLRVHRVVTIGTPHRGTAMAGRALATNARQMRLGSPWLVSLAQGEPPERYRRFTCFWSRCDNIVFPTESATLPGADNRQLDVTPHVRMVYHPEVFAEILRLTLPS
jgi:triacylglycerol esterase/lipase EstA (alpha/beta hydrolase family)